MRVIYPEEIDKEIDKLAQYMTYDREKRKMIPKKDAPEGTMQMLLLLRKKCDEIERR